MATGTATTVVRADVVGSLLRPEHLQEAREAARAGTIDAGALRGLTLSYQERRIYHLHEQIDRAIGAERLEPALRVAPVLGPFVED